MLGHVEVPRGRVRGRTAPRLRLTARAAQATYTETTGSEAHTWTNYTNAGGYEGPTIPDHDTIQIACRVQGFRVADGNTWWYQIASPPWNYTYYVSADPFYNDGQTEGSLLGTPFVDPNVPECGSGSGTPETAGSEAHTWTNYSDAGGTEGPTIGGGATVRMACKVTGFRVADGNTWWYRIGQSPWNNAYYVSADAFYNNGQTSGSLLGTPFVDPNVPNCSEPSGSPSYGETTGSEAHTWTNYSNAGGGEGPTIPGNDTVQIECKVTGFAVADGNTWWYKIASAPWSGAYYVSADAFYNNGETSGSLLGTPFVDQAVPNCAGEEAQRPAGETTGSEAHTWANYSHAGGTEGPTIPSNTTVSISCRVQGFAVADGNTWWYLVSSAPWNNIYYVSADAFYNNGATSGSLIGTPWVDPNVPVCVGNYEAPIGSAYGSYHAVGHATGCVSGDPVDCASGDFWQTFTDVSIGGRGPGLVLTRTYNSLGAGAAGIFGYGWSSSLDQHLGFTEDGTINITLDDGSEIPASPNGSGGYTLPASANASLVKNENGTYTLAEQASKFLTFSATGKLTAIRDLNGYETTLAYNPSGQLETVTDAAGRTLTFVFGSNGFVSSVIDPLGRKTTYGYDGAGDLTSVMDPIGRTWSFAYDEGHHMLKMIDPRGGVVTNTYGSESRVVAQTDPAGLTTTFAYSGDNFSSLGGTTTITDPHGSVTIEQYANGFMTEITKAAGTAEQGTWTYTYDPNTLGTTSVTDPNGNVVRNTYDGSGQLLSATDALGNTTSYTYNSFEEPLTSTTPLGHTTTRTYDAHGNLTSIEDPEGNVTHYEYEDGHLGDLTAVVDPEGRTERLTYDAYGDVTSRSVSPQSGIVDTTRYVYDSDGELVCEASADATAAGVSCPAAGAARVADTTTHVYDADGEEISSTDALGHTTTYGYDGDGDRASITDPRGDLTTMTYDADNRLLTTTKAANSSSPATTTNSYDLVPGSGACASLLNAAYCTMTGNPDGDLTVHYFNARNDEIEFVRPGGQTTRYGYDAAGNKTLVIDASGRTTSYSFDADNHETSITYSDGVTPDVEYAYDQDGDCTSMHDGTGTTTYSYNTDGRLISVTDGAGVTTSYGYNKAGDTTSIGYPNGKAISRSYDGAGRLVLITDWLGHTTSFVYDSSGNLVSTVYPNGDTVASSYSATNSLLKTEITDGTHELAGLTYARDEDELVSQETAKKISGAGGTFTYNDENELTTGAGQAFAYDPAGNLTSADGVAQSFNSEDELTATASSAGTSTFGYDAEGNRTSAIPSNGLPTRYTYDQAGRLTEIAELSRAPVVKGLSPSSGLAVGGTKVKIKGEGFAAATTVTFGAAAATNVKVLSSKEITAIAPAGEGIVDVEVTTPGGTSQPVPADRFSYTGTTAGALMSGAAKRSKASSIPAPTIYAYNGDGLRTSETTGTVTGQFTYDITPAAPEVIADATNYYVYGPGGLPIEQISHAETAEYFFHDALGSTRALLTASGTVGATYAYGPYGTLERTKGTLTTPLLFGQGYDDKTGGLIYLIHRYYDPATGQFLTVDPDLSETEAPYSYAEGDPMNMADPDGAFSFSALASGVLGAAEGFVGNAAKGIVGIELTVYQIGSDASALRSACDNAWDSYACGKAIQKLGVDVSSALVDAVCALIPAGGAYACEAAVSAGGTYLLDRYGIQAPATPSQSSDRPPQTTGKPPSSSAASGCS